MSFTIYIHGVDLSYMDHLVSSDPSSAITDHAQQEMSEHHSADHDETGYSSFHNDGNIVHNPLDAVLPRQLLYRIIDVFLTYLYPLYPLPHWPTLVNDILGRREERSGEVQWTTMVLGIIAYTVAQVPCQIVQLSKTDARELVERCTSRVANYLSQDFTTVSWERRKFYLTRGADTRSVNHAAVSDIGKCSFADTLATREFW